ncbi:hypothetical protein AhnVgp090 [Adoxophyes honmai nucleopolyhedrovirus]|uniref:Uncharacterized protein n=1 Tax=Adoxophyes honmai nucleopolyhedrovirus TaxID=224399 RepID=Q80LK6_NPVAH|nr:hypothetical protein AhnVgp090 [Adoxophyes honmai nucleopolyhedrovirus]BAC67341.1 hypothetical protein [Adoxophyes honmai nucleopolyhedrovirus]
MFVIYTKINADLTCALSNYAGIRLDKLYMCALTTKINYISGKIKFLVIYAMLLLLL